MIELWTNQCGLFSVGWNHDIQDDPHSCIHILPDIYPFKPKNWVWGYYETYYDGPISMLGAGPLFLIVWPGKWK